MRRSAHGRGGAQGSMGRVGCWASLLQVRPWRLRACRPLGGRGEAARDSAADRSGEPAAVAGAVVPCGPFRWRGKGTPLVASTSLTPPIYTLDMTARRGCATACGGGSRRGLERPAEWAQGRPGCLSLKGRRAGPLWRRRRSARRRVLMARHATGTGMCSQEPVYRGNQCLCLFPKNNRCNQVSQTLVTPSMRYKYIGFLEHVWIHISI